VSLRILSPSGPESRVEYSAPQFRRSFRSKVLGIALALARLFVDERLGPLQSLGVPSALIRVTLIASR